MWRWRRSGGVLVLVLVSVVLGRVLCVVVLCAVFTGQDLMLNYGIVFKTWLLVRFGV